MKQIIKEQMTNIANDIIEHYMSDFVNDQKYIECLKGKFIWIPYCSGTHLFIIDESLDNLKRLRLNQTEKYLFGYSTPQQQLYDSLECWKCSSIKNTEKHYYYNGYTLKAVTPTQSYTIFRDEIKSLINKANRLCEVGV
jgi:hypothetical protein